SAAEREARRRFGDVDVYRREARAIDQAMHSRRKRMELFDAIRQEVRHAFHALRNAPAFSFIAVFTLALGLGATTAIFTLLDRVVLRPLPYPGASRLIHIGTLWHKRNATDEYRLSVGQYVYLEQNSRSLASLGLYDGDVSIVPGDGVHPAERVRTVEASASVFSILGIRPERGRLFGSDEERSRDKTSAVISHGYWLRRFGGDPGVIGRRVDLGWGPPVEIVGVLPPGANPPEMDADLWTRKYINPSDAPINNHTHTVIGLLAPGVTIEQAGADIQRLQDRFQADHPDVYPAAFLAETGFAMHVSSLRDRIVGATIVRSCWLLFAAVGFVLLIAASNVANLFIVRIESRRREIAVRTALGAGWRELALHFLSESLMIALLAAIGSIGLAWVLLREVVVAAPQTLPRLAEVSLDGWSIVFCTGVSIAFGVVFGLLPVGSAHVDIGALRDGARGATTSRRRELARRTLVLAQFTLAVVLLSGAALMLRSFERLRNVRPGFDPVGVLTMRVILPPSRYLSYRQTEPFWHELTRRVEALPGVARAGATDVLPLDNWFGGTTVEFDGVSDADRSRLVGLVHVTPGFFETMGMKVSGALPTWQEVEAASAPAVVSGVFARASWKDADALGHTVNPFSMPGFRVVGVAEDVYGNGFRSPPVDAVYFPLVPPPLPDTLAKLDPGFWASRSMTLVVRAPHADLSALTTAVRNIVAQIDPQVPIADVRPMELVVAQSMADTSFTMALLVVAATIAMVLSAVGIYGVISYLVSQRRAEIGIRIALGAQMREVSRLVVGQSLRLAVAGVAIGTIAAIAGTRVLGSLLFEVSPTDPIALGGTVVVLLVVAFLASLGPTRRAAKIDPVEAMRSG
ncbi:MAG TPA: ABC transporter permease, partial [Gemmatimonadaceae bacterium]|nr:ABC transporter permease [Gemmatimonadaceae bacterium]